MYSKEMCVQILLCFLLIQIIEIADSQFGLKKKGIDNQKNKLPNTIDTKLIPVLYDFEFKKLDYKLVKIPMFKDINNLNSTIDDGFLTNGYEKILPFELLLFAYLPDNPEILVDSQSVIFDKMKKVIFYTHGFWTRHLDDSLAMKKALFEGADDFDCIVLVDWKVGSLHDLDLFNTFKNYEIAANINIPVVGEFIANFINQKLPRHIYIHLIGHSLGAQISGIAARKIKESSGRIIDRISAIDPAGPIFEYSSFLFTVNNTNTLRSSDAKFVDVIHASTVLGMINEVGHLDTYIYETDCSIFNPFCTHRRAVLFYQASINKCSQLTCSNKNLSLNGQCIIDTNSELSSLGYLAHMYQGRGKHIARFYKSLCSAYLNLELPAKKRICREPPSPDSNCKFQPYESKCHKNETKLVCKLDKHQYQLNDYNTSDTNSLKLQTVTWVIDDNKVL